MTIVLRLTFVFLITVVVRIRDTSVEHKVVHQVIYSSCIKHVSVCLLVDVIIAVFIHIDIASSSSVLDFLLSLLFLFFPHLGDASGKFLIDWSSHISILLN